MTRALKIFILLILTGCGRSVMDRPTIDRQKMVEIFTDLHIAESILKLNLGTDSLRQMPVSLERQILENHGTDTLEFNRSFNWYSGHPEELGRIYDEVIIELSRRRASSTSVNQ